MSIPPFLFLLRTYGTQCLLSLWTPLLARTCRRLRSSAGDQRSFHTTNLHAGVNEGLRYLIGDFGSALTEEDCVRDPDVDENGDSAYLAPEVLANGVCPQSDVFSLGISILEVLTERKPPSNGPEWLALRNLRKGLTLDALSTQLVCPCSVHLISLVGPCHSLSSRLVV